MGIFKIRFNPTFFAGHVTLWWWSAFFRGRIFVVSWPFCDLRFVVEFVLHNDISLTPLNNLALCWAGNFCTCNTCSSNGIILARIRWWRCLFVMNITARTVYSAGRNDLYIWVLVIPQERNLWLNKLNKCGINMSNGSYLTLEAVAANR